MHISSTVSFYPNKKSPAWWQVFATLICIPVTKIAQWRIASELAQVATLHSYASKPFVHFPYL